MNKYSFELKVKFDPPFLHDAVRLTSQEGRELIELMMS